jgi:alpha-L-rhamnosidase
MTHISEPSIPTFTLATLRVEHTPTPLGIDVEAPRFSWQMEAPADTRGVAQSAYRIVVNDERGAVAWDTGRVTDDVSLGIPYAGQPLQPTTRYTWTVTVWDRQEATASATSWFETGLMNPNPDLSAWDGATWIGGGDDDLVLYAPYLSVFKVRYTLQLEAGSTRAAFVLGANDSRLMDRNKNMYGIESDRDASYVAFELDISGVDGSEDGLARVNIYRVGYAPGDSADTPLESLTIPRELIHAGNAHEAHDICLECDFGVFAIFVGGTDEANRITLPPGARRWDEGGLNVNPVGKGNDYISYPMLADIGFAAVAGQRARFSDLRVTNYRPPCNALFHEDLADGAAYDGIYAPFVSDADSGLTIEDGAYRLAGGDGGAFVVADSSRNAMPMLRTEFVVDDRPVARARLYVTARGIYEMYINGRRVGDDYFTPDLTQYNVTHMVQTYDVTDMILSGGENAMGAWLGEGWWSGNATYSGQNWNYFGDRQSLLAKLVITHADGGTRVITTNPVDWRYYGDGPVVYGSFFQGEVYDAAREAAIDGWNEPGYDDAAWRPAVEVPLDESTAYFGVRRDYGGLTSEHHYRDMALIGQIGENAGIVDTLTAQSVQEVRPGVYVYDMGQNMAGIPRVTIRGGRAGDRITLRFAEVTYPDMAEYGDNVGMIMLENIRAALAQDIYILKGGDEVIQPRFTFHGYRYIEITGIDAALPPEDVEGLVISSIHEVTADYETSNAGVNRLWRNIVWSQLGNFLSIPTDCPQRNERMGWSGDISVYSRTATYIADADAFLARHMMAMRDTQHASGRFADIAPLGGGFGGILWGSAGITVPWEVYQQYDDVEILRRHYDAMARYIAFLDTRIDADTGLLREGPLGDWLSPENAKTEPAFLWAAYHVYDLWIMTRVAGILSKTGDADTFRTMHDERKAFFNERFVDATTHKTVRSDGSGLIDTQSSYAVPLALGVFSDEHVPYAVEHLVAACRRKNVDDGGVARPAYSLMTGFIGTAWINLALSGHGHSDVAYRLLQQRSYPSWLYSIDQGATTIWERLNSYTLENGFGGNNSMNSFNHYSFGAVGAWMINHSLGIQRDESSPGWKCFVLQPTPDPDGAMTWARGHYDSPYGRIASEWECADRGFVYRVTVPANTTATLYLPAADVSAVTESSRPLAEVEGVRFLGYENGRMACELGAGRYEFVL